MYCTNCGAQIEETVNFCPVCGRETPGGEARRQAAFGWGPPRRLYRLTYDKKIAGICSGLARYLDVDVTLMRVLVITLFFLSGGMALLAYIAAWIIMPTDREVAEPYPTARTPQPAA
jgi:phage shock protein C